MVDDNAFRIRATGADARVYAFVIYTSFIAWTIRILNAFWSAAAVRVSEVFGQTIAGAVIASGVRATRTRIA